MTAIEVAAGTIVLYADIGCPWAHMAHYRLVTTRSRLGLEEKVRFDVRPFPLELINDMATPKLILDAEVPVVGGLEPGAGWQVWQAPAHDYPVTTLPAMEAVEVAKEQGLEAGAAFDRALRRALFGQSRNISMRHEILAVAEECGLDAEAIRDGLVAGRTRAYIEQQVPLCRGETVQGSPTLFFPDGSRVHNPGIRVRWEGAEGVGFPVVERDDPGVYEELLRRALL
ncbi:putative DsbA family dithiol-disulfide isomerase [Lipingzhangella halophila]|uniref:Putative DsbA family dithiol-disulfide isomerase n=1 Tax=Lipingzhangella halophila TaxID=1783352 RepID=A0A7W7W134_9ACTN|nr:DsbA family protein [Lipingzhangella halophila]MBB4930552.1 putative DsbA family dithiol-disulfide isomerase [Lipingzhangella halophila]